MEIQATEMGLLMELLLASLAMKAN